MRTLIVATLFTVGCTIHLHVDVPPAELAKLRAQPEPAPEQAPPPRPHLVAATARHERLTEHCPLDDAQAAYVDGDYVGALQKAVHSNHAGWRIIAATACALHDEQWVTRAVPNLNPVERSWLGNVCRRQGLILTNLDSDHPRIVRAAFDDDDED
jgi:hypothetical protein